MYVFPVEEFLRMSAAEPHQELMRRGLLVEPQVEDSSVAAFVSHQWCGSTHPDPKFMQLRTLQGMFHRAAQGTLHIDADIVSVVAFREQAIERVASLRACRFMWLDFFSVPQPSAEEPATAEYEEALVGLRRAVLSLPFYIEKCVLFLVLAPVVRHEDGSVNDYRTWRARGWCRLERLSRQFGTRGGAVLLVKRTDTVFEIGRQECLLDPVGTGSFSHEEDRQQVGVVVQRLLTSRIKHLARSEKWDEFRQTLAWSPRLTEGLGISCEASGLSTKSGALDGDDVVGGFLRELHYAPDMKLGRRPTPLLIAAGLGHVTVMNALIERRASVSGSLKRASRAYCCSAGQQPIHMAAQRGHTDAMLLLLDRRAEVDALDHARQSPLFYATSFGNLAQTELLLDRRADVRRSDARALTPIAFAVIFGRAEIVQLLVARGADVLPDKTGLSIVHLACVFNSGAQTVRALAASSADMNSAIRPRPPCVAWCVMYALTLRYHFGGASFLPLAAYHSWGATPCMLAVMYVNGGEKEALAEAGADLTLKNDRGADVWQIMALFGAARDPRQCFDTFNEAFRAVIPDIETSEEP